MGERQRQHDGLVRHRHAGLLRELPQQRDDAHVHARVIREAMRHRTPVSAPVRLAHQRRRDLRPRPHSLGKVRVEQRHARLGEQLEPDAGRDQRAVVTDLPGTEHVAGHEHLRAGAPEHRGALEDQPVEHEQPEPAAGGAEFAAVWNPARGRLRLPGRPDL